MNFKLYKRKPSYVKMAKITIKEAKKILEEGINRKKVSFSEEDKEKILNGNDEDIAGFIATDDESFWFVNYDYAKKNYEIE